jgi:dTDP-4-dehydrorhamnose 3,5-epimerase
MASTATGLEYDRPDLLPAGARLMSLTTHVDERGDFTEFFRNEWHESPQPVQWNVSRSGRNVLRGVHVHALHWDYFCVVAGEMTVGLHDLRPESSHLRRSVMLQLSGGRIQMLTIPPGVAHGFYSPREAMHVIGASTYYDPPDHRRCRWDSPELGLNWPCIAPKLSAADRDALDYGEFRVAFVTAAAAARHQA